MDTIPPQIFCPTVANEEVTTANTIGAFVSFSTPTAIDSAGRPLVAQLDPSDQQGPNSFFIFGDYAITYVARDGAGNTARCSVTFSVGKVLECMCRERFSAK